MIHNDQNKNAFRGMFFLSLIILLGQLNSTGFMPTSTYFIHSFGKSHRLYRMIWLCHMWNENHWCKRWLSCEYLNTSVSVFTYSTCQKCPNICMSIFHPEISSKLYSDFISLCGKKCHKRKLLCIRKHVTVRAECSRCFQRS